MPIPGNAFLLSVDAALRSEDPHLITSRTGGKTSLWASWFPEMPHGLLANISGTDIWEQYEKQCETNLMITVRDNGQIIVRQGDDEDVYLETSLESGDELSELLDFYSSARAHEIGSSAAVSRTFGHLIQEVFLLLPPNNGELAAITLVGHQIANKAPFIASIIDMEMTRASAVDIDSDKWDEFHRILIDNQDWPSRLKECEAVGPPQGLARGDLILRPSGSTHYAGMLQCGAEDLDLLFGPAIVLRPKKEFSSMWIYDYVVHAKEAEGLPQRLCREWRNLPKLLRDLPISVPSAKRDQVAIAIAARTARMEYRQYLDSAMTMREPMGQVVATYRKRTLAAKGLYTDLLDDLHAMQCPLPFFLEYPYRLYRREDDSLGKVLAAQRLLNILVKVPLYLIVEELVSVGDLIGQEIIKALAARPPSDGTLLNMQREVIRGDVAGSLTLFSPLLDVMRDDVTWGRMVETRNRLSHPPFNPAPFLDAIDKGATLIVESLRGALSGCRFFIPTGMEYVSGKQVLTAEDICSSDASFRSIRVPVKMPIDCFPSGKIVVWRESPEASVTLGNLVSTKTVTENTLDFGLFDRMENDQARFTFLRSE